MPSITVVFGFRDKEFDRVQRCYDSLSAQTFDDFEAILVDYGSTSTVSSAIQRLAGAYGFCRYLHTDTRGYPWNRAHALNIGGRIARSEYLMTSDIDMVFARNFLETVMSHADVNRLLHCTPFWLPRGFSDWENVEIHTARLRLGDAHQKGGCQCMSTELFQGIRGFDEYYQYWGLEDHDMSYRLKAVGLEELWMNDHTSMFHQWHPQVSMMSRGYWPGGLLGRMSDHMLRHKDVIVRNSENWGQVRKTEERSVFRFLDFAQSELSQSDDLILLNTPPDRSESLWRLAEGFWELPSAHGLAVNHAFYPRRQKLVDQSFEYLSKILYRLRIPTGVDYSQNLLHSFLVEFIERNQDMIADYYLGFPAMNGVSVLVKA